MIRRVAVASMGAARSLRMFALTLLLLPVAGIALHAQADDEAEEIQVATPAFVESPTVFPAPYAGKYEARIGGSRESADGKLRLDIGYAAEIFRVDYSMRRPDGSTDFEHPGHTFQSLSFGADFFTWTRLRSTASFKFPVEAVDYYFGLSGAFKRPLRRFGVMEARLRLAHISAHLADGDPSFTDPAQKYMTYSREFADATIALAGRADRDGGARAYAGALVMFHSIPDTLGAVTPYIGVDFNGRLLRAVPLVLRLGYELRLNTELASVAEHSARLGLKLGEPWSRGVTVEGSFYHGRSHYGQHFNVVEEYFALGFAVDF